MLTSEIPAHDVVIVGQMGFAVLATEDLVGVEIYVVCKAHDDQLFIASTDVRGRSEEQR